MNDLAVFNAGRPPAAFASRRSTMNAAAQQGVQASFAVIGYKGRNWRVRYRGEDNLLKDGRGAPVPSLDVIIVGVAPNISKQWYEKRYSEGDNAAPDCFSVNGATPDPASPKRQCATCAACPHNQWGSRVTEGGKKAKACQDSRRLAVVPFGDPKNDSYGGPMMLRIPPMSLNQLANYAGQLERKGASLEFVGTRLSFDWNVAYPLITFEPIGWLDDTQAELVVGADGQSGICADPLVERMLNEVVDEATHDPKEPAAEPAQPAHDPLAGGPPRQAAMRQQQPAGASTPGPDGAGMQWAGQKPAAEQPSAPAPQRANPFGAGPTSQPTPAPQPAPTVAAQAPTAAPEQKEQVQEQPLATASMQDAPSDMQSAIDALLDM